MTDRKPEIGDWVFYIPRPGQVRANQSKLAALVVMINVDNSLELEVHAWNSEHVWQSRVQRESETLTGHCWRPKSEVVLADGTHLNYRDHSIVDAAARRPKKAAASS